MRVKERSALLAAGLLALTSIPGRALAQDFPAIHIEIEILVDDGIAEAIGQATHRNDRPALAHIQPTELKKTAKTASRTMTRKID